MSEPDGPRDAPLPPPVPPATNFAPPSPNFAAPSPTYAAPSPAYAAPSPTYAPPAGYAPPPQGYGPWTPQAGSTPTSSVPSPPPPPRAGGPGLGLVAFALAIVAAVGTSIAAGIAGFRVGLGAADRVTRMPTEADFDWSVLTPVREWVLLGEVAFWVGTVLGIWAIVQGSIAIARNRGRGWGVAAVVLAVIGPFAYGVALWLLIIAGLASLGG